MASRVLRKRIVAAVAAAAIVGLVFVFIATRPKSTEKAFYANDQSIASAIYELDGQLIDLDEYTQTATSSQSDLNVSATLSAFASGQLQALKDWAETNRIKLDSLGQGTRVQLAQDRGMIHTIKAQQNQGLHESWIFYLHQLDADLSSVDRSDTSQELLSQLDSLETQVSDALTAMGSRG